MDFLHAERVIAHAVAGALRQTGWRSRARMGEDVSRQMQRNVEVKAIDPDPVRSRRICQRLGAQDEGWLWQRDTYFGVVRGRLKLREQAPGVAHLIRYERADERQERESRYVIDHVEDPATTLAELRSAHGTLAS